MKKRRTARKSLSADLSCENSDISILHQSSSKNKTKSIRRRIEAVNLESIRGFYGSPPGDLEKLNQEDRLRKLYGLSHSALRCVAQPLLGDIQISSRFAALLTDQVLMS